MGILFIHKETAEIQELRIVALEEPTQTILFGRQKGLLSYGVGDFVLYGPGLGEAKVMKLSEMVDHFELLGIL